MGAQMRQLREQAMPVMLTGIFGMMQIVAHEAYVLLDVRGIERGTDGNVYRFHCLATLSGDEAIRLRGLLNDVLASVMGVPTCHDWSRNVTQH
jgi:hypothetical protein